MAKDTIYIEADDEITVIIDKVLSSKEKVVAIVLPKRAPVLLSVVNMKLLKKTALDAKKSIVIITSDKAIEPIAASAKVYTALSLSSKPTIPTKKTASKKPETIAIDGQPDVPQAAAAVAATEVVADTEPLELPESSESAEESTVKEEIITDVGDKKSKKRFKIPDFNRFQLKLWGGVVAVVLLIVGWVFGFVILPKATVTINTITDRLDISTEFTVQTGLSESDYEKAILAATKVEVSKENTATVPATGQKDIGAKATGTVNLTNCIESDGPQTVPIGTRFSASGVSFETTEVAVLPEASFNSSGQCRSKNNGDDKTVQVIAVSPGAQANISSQTLVSSISGIQAVGSNMSGGTTELVKVVSAEDIKKATEQIGGSSSAEATEELREKLTAAQLQPLNETIESSAGPQKVSAAVDAEAENVIVTQVTTYSMLGVKSSDISGFLDKKIQEKIADQSKNIRSNGFDSAVYRLLNKSSADSQVIGLQTVVTTGQVFDEDAIKKEVVGKKRGDIEKLLEQRDGVRSVSVEYSPIWITTTPKNENKINVVVNEIQE